MIVVYWGLLWEQVGVVPNLAIGIREGFLEEHELSLEK